MAGRSSIGARSAVNDGAWHSFGAARGGAVAGRNGFAGMSNGLRSTSPLRSGGFGGTVRPGLGNRGYGGFGGFGGLGYRGRGCWNCGFGWGSGWGFGWGGGFGLGFGWGWPYWDAGLWGYPYAYPYPYWDDPGIDSDYAPFYDPSYGPYGNSDPYSPSTVPNTAPDNAPAPNGPAATPQGYETTPGTEPGAGATNQNSAT
jgi:hypothetical protein